METKPTFAERAKRMREAAMDLKVIAEEVLAEAQRMEAAEERFAARKGPRRNARQTESASR